MELKSLQIHQMVQTPLKRWRTSKLVAEFYWVSPALFMHMISADDLVKDQGFSRPRILRIREGVLQQDWVENMAQTSTS
jgi:hypothetical protein